MYARSYLTPLSCYILVDTSLRGDRVIRLSSANGPKFELLTDAVSWAEVNWLSFVDEVPPLSAITGGFKIF
jgi:hypothetical protein